MIKNPKRYLKQSEQERVRWLSRLTYARSARLVEALLASRLIQDLHFAKDDQPTSLARTLHGHDSKA